MKFKALLKSRRFWVAVVGVAAVVSSEHFGIELNVEQLVSIAVITAGWIIGDTVRETK